MTMENKKVLYINIVLLIVLVLVVAVIGTRRQRPTSGAEDKIAQMKRMFRQKGAAVSPRIPEASRYDISKIKKELRPSPKDETKNLQEVYKKYPKDDVGTNVMETWARCDPRDKEKFAALLDTDIKAQEKKLEADPKDRKSRSRLQVANALKKLAGSNFNLTREMLESIPEDNAKATGQEAR